MQILNFLVSTSCLILLLMSIHLLLAKRGNRLCHLLLSFLFFCRFGQVIITLLVGARQLDFLPLLHQFFFVLSFATPACFYLYIHSFIAGRSKLTKSDYLHFIPLMLAVVHVFPWKFGEPIDWNAVAAQVSQGKILSVTAKTGIFPIAFQGLGRPMLVATYLILAWLEVKRSKSILQEKFDSSARRWICFFIKTATFFQLAAFVPIVLGMVNRPALHTSFALINSAVLLSIMITILHQPKLFYGYLFVAAEWDDQAQTIVLHSLSTKVTAITLPIDDATNAKQEKEIHLPDEELVTPPVRKLNISNDQLSAFAILMQELMDRDKPYLAKDFQIMDLATKINLPLHQCSFTVNHIIGKNFRDWINSYRITYFIENYPLKSSRMTIEAIASEAGFKSSATFYNAFKKETGSMPKAYFSQELTN